MISLSAPKLQPNAKLLMQLLEYFNNRIVKSASISGRSFEVKRRRDPYMVKVVQGRSCKGKFSGANTDQRFGEDSWFISSTQKAEVMGVADGVGGWSEMGVDAGRFAKELMYWCSNYAKRTSFDGHTPRDLLCESYHLIKSKSDPVVGSSTACIVALRRRDCTMHTANLGDSGFLVIRNGRIFHRSEEQIHGFNTPFQLTVPPSGKEGNVHCDLPELAKSTRLPLQEGDLVLLATDGLFDNMPESMIVKALSQYQGVTDEKELQSAANSLVVMAKDLSLSPNFQSPFALKARAYNVDFPSGGKPDDITVILATVAVPKAP